MLAHAPLIDRYTPRFFNANFCETASDGASAYRGELILQMGEIADAQGRRKPPVHVLKQVALLTAADELRLLAGSLDALAEFPLLAGTFGDALSAESRVVLFTVDIATPFTALLGGAQIHFIPLVQGMVWNELIDLVALEKGDFKGQSAADKVLTLYRALRDHRFGLPAATVEEASKHTTGARRENHGAI